MAAQQINIAVILSAYDKMTAVVNSVVGNTSAKLLALQKRSEAIAKSSSDYGRKSMLTGTAVATPLIAAAKAFADQEEAALRMRAAMMQDGGRMNEKAYGDLVRFANQTSQTLTGSTADYLRMVKVLQENSIKPEEILGGIGDATAKLSVFFKMAPDEIAQFAARMKQDMGVLPAQMGGMMDMIARLQNAGVGKDGAEAVTEMGEAFSKASLGAHNLGVTGLQASKDLGALMGIFIRRGLSGATVGTNFRRIFDGLRDADKLKKSNDLAKKFGVTLDFYDKDRKFKGIAAMAGELDKLKGLSTTQVSKILKPFGGKQGLSTDFLEFLSKDGTASFNDFNKKLADQATLTAKVKVIMGGLGNAFERTKTTAINSAAAFASTYAPQLKALINNFNALFIRVTNFINTHKTLVGTVARGLAYFAAYKLTVGAAAWVLGGFFGSISNGIKIIRYLPTVLTFGANVLLKFAQVAILTTQWMGRMALMFLTRGIPAMVSFTATVWANAAAWLANPATYIILGIVAAIAVLSAIGYVVYKNWDKIMTWFSSQWISMKAQVSGIIAVFGLFLDVVVGVGKAMAGIFTFNPAMVIAGAKQAATAVSQIANGGISKAYNNGYNASIRPSASATGNKPVVQQNNTHTYHFNLTGGNTAENKSLADMVAKTLKAQHEKQLRLSQK